MGRAFESGELGATVITRHRDQLSSEELTADYTRGYIRKFDSRLRICGLLRRAAFKPRLAGLGIALFGASEPLRNRLVRATRAI